MTQVALDQMFEAGLDPSGEGPWPVGSWTPFVGMGGGDPGLDGCNYTTGFNCSCHHLYVTPLY